MTEPVEPDRLPGAPHPRETAVLYGQAEAEARFLDAAATGRLHHAWALTGPRGVGKATLAWRIARHLIAGGGAAPSTWPPTIRSSARWRRSPAPQLFLCRRPWDDKGERLRTAITVDEVRALKAFFQLSAAEGGRRVAIVDAADELNTAAANALLKILEEPPAGAVLLLVSHRPAALLPTLRSRCRELRCRPLGPEPLARALAAAGAAPDPADAAALAALAGGSVGAAFELVAGDGLARYAEIVELLATAPLDRRRAIALAEAAAGRDAAPRYALTLDLVRLALTRLALAGAARRRAGLRGRGRAPRPPRRHAGARPALGHPRPRAGRPGGARPRGQP